jgi:hypothetical protein
VLLSRVCKLLGWIALGVGAPVLAAVAFVVFFVLFDASENQAPLAPSAFAPETAARPAAQQLTQNPADYDWKAASPLGGARDADSTVRAVAPDFSELGSVSPPSGAQAAIPTPPSVEAPIVSTPPFGYTGGARSRSETTNALSTPPSGTMVAPTPTPFDPLTVVSAPRSVPPIRETAPRPDPSDISSLRSPETPAVTPPSNVTSTPRSDEPVASPPRLDAPTNVAALPSDSPTVVPTPHLDARSTSSPPSPETPAVDSTLRSNAATVASKPPAATSALVGLSSSNTSHVELAPPANMAPAAASPPVIDARIEGERISRAPTISTEIGSLNEDRPTQAVVDRKSDKNFNAATALLPDGMPPRVLIRYDGSSAEARRRAETFAKSLAEQGYEIADVRNVTSPIRSELRFSYAPDEAVALRIGDLAGVKPVRAPSPKVGLMTRPGLIELSVSAR